MAKGVSAAYVKAGYQPGCHNPRMKPALNGRNPVIHGCGQCFACVRRKVSMQAGQHVLELFSHGDVGASLGLTFRDAMLSDEQRDPEWWKAEIDALKRRLARALEPAHGRHRVRLWWKAELGETTRRQHAHIALPGVRYPFGMQEMPWWRFGHVKAQAYDVSTAYYLADYHAKPEKRRLQIAQGHSRHYGEAAFRRVVDEQRRRMEGENVGPTGRGVADLGFMLDWKHYSMTPRFREIAREEGVINRVDVDDLLAAWERVPDEKGNADGWSKRIARKEQEFRRARRQREVEGGRDRARPLLDGYPVRVPSRRA